MSFPEALRREHDLAPIGWALEQIHFPASTADLERARRRFIYQELLVMQLALAVRRAEAHEARDAIPLPTSAKIDARIRRLFPFELTAGQNRVIEEIIDRHGPRAADQPPVARGRGERQDGGGGLRDAGGRGARRPGGADGP